ncbi:GtrA family protein [Patescibacteria group bacterium]
MKKYYYRVAKTLPFLGNVTVRQFIKFSMVGVSNTIIDFSLYLLLTRIFHIHFLIANALAFVIAVTWSYTANKMWTFRDTSNRMTAQFTKFIIINLVGLGLAEGILSVLVIYFGLWDILSKFIAVLIVVFWNFWANRHWTFKDSQERL